MNKISDIFNVISARSKSIEAYSKGETPFVSNGFYNNGIIGHVEPFDNDKVFCKLSICISAFCEATVQKPPFIGRGNGGSGMTILTPIDNNITYQDLIGYSALINTNIKWRYSYGRMVTKGRISNNLLPKIKINKTLTLEKLLKTLPDKVFNKTIKNDLNLKLFPITDLFNLQHGDFHSLASLDRGKYPTVSRIDNNNGIVGYFDKIPFAHIYPKKTITVSTVTGNSFVQLDSFIATDNVVILMPKVKLNTPTLFFISTMINREKWRWMYGRQCYKSKFSTTNILLPINKKNKINERLIANILKSKWGWKTIENLLK